MATSKRSSLRTKLAFFSTLLVLFVATSLSYYVRRGQKQAIVEGQESNRADTIRALRQVARESLLVDDDTNMVNYVNLLARSASTAYAMVIDEAGKVRVHTDPMEIGKTLSDPAAQAAMEQKERQIPFVQKLKTSDGRDVIDLSLPILLGLNPPEFKGIARIGFDKKAIEDMIAQSLIEVDRRIVRAFLVALILGVVGAMLLASYITRPLEILRQGAARIGEGKLDHRIQIGGNDELHALASEFNLMAHKLGELDRMKQDFVSNVTHELRSPMTSIRGYVDLMLQGAAGPVNDDQKDYLSVVKNSAVRLGRFIDNLLDVAKIEAHKIKLTPEPLDLRALAHEMEVLFKPQLGEKKLRFDNAVPADMTQAFVDKDKLAEVLINLASNAIKFTPDEGVVRVAASEGGNHIEVRVEDTGPGIPPEAAATLFNKFEQVKSNQGKKQKGTGLGLTIAKGIIEAHGGKIWIKSPVADGRGTAFVFTIPKLTDEIRARLKTAL